MNLFIAFISTYSLGAILTYLYPFWFVGHGTAQFLEEPPTNAKYTIAACWGGLLIWDTFRNIVEKLKAKK